MGERGLKVRDNSKAVRISNLPIPSTNADLINIAAKCPRKTEMYLARDKTTGDFKGFGYIHFKTRKDAESAVETLNGLNYKNNTLRAFCATATPSDN